MQGRELSVTARAVRLRGLDSMTARLHLLVAVVVCLVLPGGSYLQGSAIFAWNMFSKSETYRMTILATFPGGERREMDPRALKPLVNPALAYFLPAPGLWRHDPVGLTFRTGLPAIGGLQCRAGTGAIHVEVTLEERADLDAAPRVTRATTECR